LELLLTAILVGSRDHRTQFWKGAIQGSFHKSLVAIGPFVSEAKIFYLISSPSQPNFAEMILVWSPFKLLSVSAVLYPNTFWLKIEQFWPFEEISIFSNGGHFGYRTALTDTILIGDHPRIISAKN
jgi:hypothetical protein